jgi:hypothetical protein
MATHIPPEGLDEVAILRGNDHNKFSLRRIFKLRFVDCRKKYFEKTLLSRLRRPIWEDLVVI